MVENLFRLFLKWATDKVECSEGPIGNAEAYGYAGVYECLFHRYRLDVKAVLEIGIGTMIPGAPFSMVDWALPGYRPGGSLRVWREYFENATIFGLDIQADTQFTGEERIITRLCDSTNEYEVQQVMSEPEFPKEFDIIIDDASHFQHDQIETFRNFFRYVKGNGIYILEDLTEGAFASIIDPVRMICGDSPFFFLGPSNNMLVVMRRD